MRTLPLSAMVAIWHHIIVSFSVFVTERVHLNLDILHEMKHWAVNWGEKCILAIRGYHRDQGRVEQKIENRKGELMDQ